MYQQALCSVWQFPENYYYHMHDNKNCYLYHDNISYFNIIKLSKLSHSST